MKITSPSRRTFNRHNLAMMVNASSKLLFCKSMVILPATPGETTRLTLASRLNISKALRTSRSSTCKVMGGLPPGGGRFFTTPGDGDGS